MAEPAKMSAFAKYAWFALGYNVLVIVWGVFLRASRSGDGCGQFWLTCNGELIPSAPQFKTIIEFSHRMTTAIDGFVMLILLGWAIKIFVGNRSTQSRQVLYAAIGSFFFVITEAAVGAGLVLTGNVAEAVTDVRPLWAMGHLINTFVLLTFLTLTAWFATKERRVALDIDGKTAALIVLGILGLLAVGLSGSLAALSNMLFPSQSLAESAAKDFSATSNIILRLRLSHPIMSILTSVYLIFLAGWLKAKSRETTVGWWSNAVSLLVIGQVIFGGATLLTLGPIVMQLGHLLLADAVWIAFVLLVASYMNSAKELA
ncbi:MAG: COX15/CtaA family protein [Pyrinomonadaceae bacterium]